MAEWRVVEFLVHAARAMADDGRTKVRKHRSSNASHSQERKGFAFALKEPEPSVLRSHKSKKKLNTK